MTTKPLPKSEILKAITEYYEVGDLVFMETVNNMTFGYKSDLKRKLNHNEQRLD